MTSKAIEQSSIGKPVRIPATDNLNAALTQAEGMLDLMLEAYAAVDMAGGDKPAQLFSDDNLQVQITAIHRSVRDALDNARELDRLWKERGG